MTHIICFKFPFNLYAHRASNHILPSVWFKLNPPSLADQMNVCWHRPSQKKKSSAFMYITFRMSSSGTRRVCHVSSHVKTSRVQHMICAIFPHINVKKILLSNSTSSWEKSISCCQGRRVSLPPSETFTWYLCVGLNHSTQFLLVIIIITACTEGQERCYMRRHQVLVQ